MIKCPVTGRAVSTGIEVCSTEALPVVTATMVCPACAQVHHWTKNDAWLAAGGEQYRGRQAANDVAQGSPDGEP